MQPVFLRFPDKTTAMRAFETMMDPTRTPHGWLAAVPPDTWVGSTYCVLQVVFGTGILFASVATLQVDLGNLGGAQVYVFAQRLGYHVNLLWGADAVPSALAPYVITPATPTNLFG